MLLTPKEVAEKLKVSEQTVLRWLRNGKLKGVKAGRLWRIREEDLQEFIKEGNNEGETNWRKKRSFRRAQNLDVFRTTRV